MCIRDRANGGKMLPRCCNLIVSKWVQSGRRSFSQKGPLQCKCDQFGFCSCENASFRISYNKPIMSDWFNFYRNGSGNPENCPRILKQRVESWKPWLRVPPLYMSKLDVSRVKISYADMSRLELNSKCYASSSEAKLVSSPPNANTRRCTIARINAQQLTKISVSNNHSRRLRLQFKQTCNDGNTL